MSIRYFRISPHRINISCILCKKVHTIPITKKQLKSFENGDDIQNVIPKVSRALREMLISGICGECWNEVHGVKHNLDEDEEYFDLICDVCNLEGTTHTNTCGRFCTEHMKDHMKSCGNCNRAFSGLTTKMLRKVKLASETDARDYLKELSARGYNVFRGQHKDWPIRPSFFRTVGAERDRADSRLRAFFLWCSETWRLLSKYSKADLEAVAQHYGIPTVLVDVTYSFETALFFAHGENPAFRPTVYAWKRDSLEKLAGITLVESNVPDLWRLEAQQGFFLRFDRDILLDLEAADTYQVEFPAGPATNRMLMSEDVYPTRKSHLETVLDEYFHKLHREEISNYCEELTQKHPATFMRVSRCYAYQSYLLAFDQSKLHAPIGLIKNTQKDWMKIASRPYSAVEPTRSQIFQLGNSDFHAESQINAALTHFESGHGYPKFEVKVFNDELIDNQFSKAFNWLFDGLVAFPYSRSNRLKALSRSYQFLSALPGDVDLSRSEKRVDEIFGEYCLIRFAPENGPGRGTFVSIRTLERAVDPAAIRSLRPFFRNLIANRWREITCFRVQPYLNFNFRRFVSLFAEEVIPSEFLEYAQLCLSTSPPTWVPWNVVFDPLSLNYFTIGEYLSGKYPFGNEEKLNELVYLFARMNTEDVRDEVFSLALALGKSVEDESIPPALALERQNSTYTLRIHGFTNDPRELWEIDDAVRLLQIFVQNGGTKLLTISTTLGKGQTIGTTAVAFGAFEVWLIAHRRWETFFKNPEENLQTVFPSFLHHLSASDQALKRLIGGCQVRREFMHEQLSRIYLEVPDEEKDQVKSLGARWDAKKKLWWLDSRDDVSQFRKWVSKLETLTGHLVFQELHQAWSDDDIEDMLDLQEFDLEVFFVPWTCENCGEQTTIFHGAANERSMCVTPQLYWPETLALIDEAREHFKLNPMGTIKPRFSSTESYKCVSQGCSRCDAIIEEFTMWEDFGVVFSEADPDEYQRRFVLSWPPQSLIKLASECGLYDLWLRKIFNASQT